MKVLPLMGLSPSFGGAGWGKPARQAKFNFKPIFFQTYALYVLLGKLEKDVAYWIYNAIKSLSC